MDETGEIYVMQDVCHSSQMPGAMRWVRHPRSDAEPMVLQQEWHVTKYRNNYPVEIVSEWRDVPIFDPIPGEGG